MGQEHSEDPLKTSDGGASSLSLSSPPVCPDAKGNVPLVPNSSHNDQNNDNNNPSMNGGSEYEFAPPVEVNAWKQVDIFDEMLNDRGNGGGGGHGVGDDEQKDTIAKMVS